MKRTLLPKLPADSHPVPIPEDESHHLIQVLRVRNGEEIECLDGMGSRCKGTIELTGKGTAQVHAKSKIEREPSLLSLPIRLEMSILKGDAMEWVIEKAVEIGVREFIPIEAAHSVVQIDKKGPEAFRERWQKIADQALKQCGRLDRMKILNPSTLQSVQSGKTTRVFTDEASRTTSPGLIETLSKIEPKRLIEDGISVLIGPEGGWNDEERRFLTQNSIPSVSLGPWVFRAETAALFAASLIVGSMR